jgi:putative transcriptional regulator
VAEGSDIGVTTSLSCHVLCAVPQLVDPNFVRSVVLMIEHNEDGAFGLVINNCLPTRVADVTESLGLEWYGEEDEKVRLGGPVEPVRGFVLHDQPGWDPLADEVCDGLLITASLDAITPEEGIGAGGHFLFTLGYAGWGEGQLEREMTSGSWVAVPISEAGFGVTPRWIFETAPEAMWQEALASIGVDPARLVGHRGIGEPIAKA